MCCTAADRRRSFCSMSEESLGNDGLSASACLIERHSRVQSWLTHSVVVFEWVLWIGFASALAFLVLVQECSTSQALPWVESGWSLLVMAFFIDLFLALYC